MGEPSPMGMNLVTSASGGKLSCESCRFLYFRQNRISSSEMKTIKTNSNNKTKAKILSLVCFGRRLVNYSLTWKVDDSQQIEDHGDCTLEEANSSPGGYRSTGVYLTIL